MADLPPGVSLEEAELANIVMEARDASLLPPEEVHAELARYGVAATGVSAQNIRTLQSLFDEEAAQENSERHEIVQRMRRAKAAEARRAVRAEEEAEELEALAEHPRTRFWIELAARSETPADACLRGQLTDITARAVSRVVASNKSLVSLDLSRCALSDAAGAHIARMLTANSRLRKLELDRNNFTAPTAFALGEALCENRTLQHLSLERNNLTATPDADEGASADYSGVQRLAEMLQRNSTLTALNLFDTGLGIDGGRTLAANLERGGRSVIILDLDNCGVAPNELERISARLAANREHRQHVERQAREERLQARELSKQRRAAAVKAEKRRQQELWHDEQAELRRQARAQAKVEAAEAKRAADEEAKRLAIERQLADERRAAEAKAKSKKKKKGKKK